MSASSYQDWIIEQNNDGIVWLKIDVHASSINTLSAQVFVELQKILTELTKNLPLGVAITSNKPRQFIAGADIKEFSQITDKRQALEKVHFGQRIMNQLDQLDCPTIAVINASCLGAGLELALACDYRIAANTVNTRISLPEVNLGIHPGYGGTVRILRYTSPLAAMDLILTGRSIDPHTAKKMGLIDHALPHWQLENAARKILLDKPVKRKAPVLAKLLNHAMLRPLIAMQLRKQVSRKALPEHYPAPYAIIHHWAQYYGNEQKMLQHEAHSVAELSTHTATKNLVRVFRLQSNLKALADRSSLPARHVHIIGAGVMGSDIATWCVSQGLTITLQDLRQESLAKAKSRAHGYFKKRLKDRISVKFALDHFILDAQGYGLNKADVIIEAIVENRQVKRDLYTSIEPKIKKDALLATNTSSIEIEELCTAVSDPARMVGLHFFNPVTKMPLIEIVHGKQTHPETLQRAINFARQIGKLPLPVKSSPGFLVNRVLTPYMVEAGLLKEAGESIRDIDHAATNFGMPMGPVELADTVGLDVGLHVAELLSSVYGYTLPASFKSMVKAGALGKKTGKGFYLWKNGKKITPKFSASRNRDKIIKDRLMLRLINEAVACNHEKVVASSDLLDAGIIFGTGFAPFRGGPINYAECAGPAKLLNILKDLQKQYGDRYSPNAGWDDLNHNSYQ